MASSNPNTRKSVEKTIQLEWQMCESESEWQTRLEPPLDSTISHLTPVARRSWVTRRWWIAAGLLLCLVIVGCWTWYTAQKGLEQIEADLRESIEVEQWAAISKGEEIQKPSAFALTNTTPNPPSSIHLLSLTKEFAIVEVIFPTSATNPALRQTRVYQAGPLGWQRIAPTPALWGAPRHTETEYFVFRYYAEDELAVMEVAAIIDDLSETIATNFNLTLSENPLSQEDKIQISVEPSHLPGAIASNVNPDTPLVVASPAIYLAPVEISRGELLAQAVYLALLQELTTQVGQHYEIPYTWDPLVVGLRLWQLWENDLPLAAWRKPLVTWVFTESDPLRKDPFSEAPSFYTEFCAMHRLWMVSTLELLIPIDCRANSWEKNYLPTLETSRKAPLTLERLAPIYSTPQDPGISQPFYRGYAVMMATVIDYTAATFGVEHVPLLMSRLKDQTAWNTLTQELFGITAADFEAGWHTFLAEEYDIHLP